jgi:hypothetical protein
MTGTKVPCAENTVNPEDRLPRQKKNKNLVEGTDCLYWREQRGKINKEKLRTKAQANSDLSTTTGKKCFFININKVHNRSMEVTALPPSFDWN